MLCQLRNLLDVIGNEHIVLTIIIILKISQFLHILEAITLTEGVLLLVMWYVVSVEEPVG